MNTILPKEELEVMNTTLFEEQMEASTSRHLLNLSKQITTCDNHINSCKSNYVQQRKLISEHLMIL